jgi:glycine betaine/choline ABC-type transport system substrate-binding protein
VTSEETLKRLAYWFSAVALTVALACAISASVPGRASACVGRTLFIGHYDSPDQVMVANLLAVFIDERTGTTVKLTRFATRDEAFEAMRTDKISIYSDYSGVVLRKWGGEAPSQDEEKNFARIKEILNRKFNVVWLEPFGYDRYFTEKGRAGEKPGPAGLMLCKDALSKFPALPKLLGKLRGVLDNETMATLVREAGASDPKTVARKFLKSRKLI